MVIIVMGPAGSGKSLVGTRLAAALGWPFFEGDDFHPAANVARMHAGLPLGDAERAPWLAALAGVVARSLTTKTSAVLTCSALRRAYRRALVPADAAPDTVRFVYLQADPALLAARLAARAGHFFAPNLLASQLATLEPPDADERASVLTLDASGTPDQLVEAVRSTFDV
ncbi:MAG TPA: gluconokinase [Gemmatirosa sp.]